VVVPRRARVNLTPSASATPLSDAAMGNNAHSSRRGLEHFPFSCAAQPPSFPPLARGDERGVLRHAISRNALVQCSCLQHAQAHPF